MKKLHALVIGATGATGRELVNKLLKDDDFSKVTIFVRTSPNIKHEKLKSDQKGTIPPLWDGHATERILEILSTSKKK